MGYMQTLPPLSKASEYLRNVEFPVANAPMAEEGCFYFLYQQEGALVIPVPITKTRKQALRCMNNKVGKKSQIEAGMTSPSCVIHPSLVFLQKVGCDYEIDSNATEDRCGVCLGDGSACQTVKKLFRQKEGSGKRQLGCWRTKKQINLLVLKIACKNSRNQLLLVVTGTTVAKKIQESVTLTQNGWWLAAQGYR